MSANRQPQALPNHCLSAVLQEMPAAVVVMDEHGQCLDANAAAIRLLGSTADYVRTLTFPSLAAASRSMTNETGTLNSAPLHTEITYRRRDDGIIDLEVVVAPVIVAGERLLVGVIHDLGDQKQTEAALVESESRLQRIVETTPDLFCVLDKDGLYRFVNSAYVRILGYTADQLIGRSLYDFIHPDDGPSLAVRIRSVVENTDSGHTIGTGSQDIIYRARHAGGAWVDLEARWQTLSSSAGEMIGVLVISRDVTERRRTEVALRASEERFRSLVQNASDLVVIVDASGILVYVSPAIQRMLDFTPDDAIGTTGLNWIHPDDRAGVESILRQRLFQQGARESLEFRLRHRDGSWRFVEVIVSNLLDDPSVGGIVLNAHDATERKRLEDQLTHQAFHDPLTGLANRALLLDRIGQALARAARHSSGIAVLLLDLDRFKVVNESLGHDAGDQLLVEVSQRLARCLQPGDTIARPGGDEFIVLMDGVTDPAETTAMFDRLLAALHKPFKLAGRSIRISASGGIVLRDARNAQPADILRDADIALYEAKAAGKGRAVRFNPSMLRATRRLDIETGLREAIERDQVRIGFQPIVDLDTGTVIGVEALARWMHPTRGLIQPMEFIPIAEESGLIVELWRRVVESACRSAIAWQRLRADGPPLRVSVNISAGHLQQADLASQVAVLLDATGFEPSSLVLEITENALLQDANAVLHSIRSLKDLGVQLAIDDFGTGYSALSYLRRFPVDSIKIDRSFVRELPDDRGAAAIVKAICTLGQSLEMDVIVEGVERPDQLACVRSLGADHAQGFYFARPLPAHEIPAVLPTGAFAQHLNRADPSPDSSHYSA
jgi:diguanylate cyclase (GGDEF)-like protein/PAS domain S-box-containing protein